MGGGWVDAVAPSLRVLEGQGVGGVVPSLRAFGGEGVGDGWVGLYPA